MICKVCGNWIAPQLSGDCFVCGANPIDQNFKKIKKEDKNRTTQYEYWYDSKGRVVGKEKIE
jgi:hypothetical protein